MPADRADLLLGRVVQGIVALVVDFVVVPVEEWFFKEIGLLFDFIYCIPTTTLSTDACVLSCSLHSALRLITNIL